MPEQEIYLKKACGTSRFVFNWGLTRWKEAKAQGVEQCGPMALKKEFNAIKREQFLWTLEVTKNAVEDGFRRLSAAMKNYYDSKGGERNGEKSRTVGVEPSNNLPGSINESLIVVWISFTR